MFCNRPHPLWVKKCSGSVYLQCTCMCNLFCEINKNKYFHKSFGRKTEFWGEQPRVLTERVTPALRRWISRNIVEARGRSSAAGAEPSAGSALNLAADGLALRVRRQLFTWAQVGCRRSSKACRGNNALTTDTAPTTQCLSAWQRIFLCSH